MVLFKAPVQRRVLWLWTCLWEVRIMFHTPPLLAPPPTGPTQPKAIGPFLEGVCSAMDNCICVVAISPLHVLVPGRTHATPLGRRRRVPET